MSKDPLEHNDLKNLHVTEEMFEELDRYVDCPHCGEPINFDELIRKFGADKSGKKAGEDAKPD